MIFKIILCRVQHENVLLLEFNLELRLKPSNTINAYKIRAEFHAKFQQDH